MKITFDTAAFAEAARAISAITARDTDILAHARIAVAAGRMSLTMSNLDMEAEATIDCVDEGDMLAAIPSAILDFFGHRASEGGEGSLTFEGEAYFARVAARHGRARATMNILKGESFPLLSRAEPVWTMTLRAHELCVALDRVRRAVRPEDGQYSMLIGPFLHTVEDRVRLIGADGNRIHLVDLDGPVPSGPMPKRGKADPGAIIPVGAVKEILRIFSGDESEIVLGGTRQLLSIKAERLRFATKLIDAEYIPYRDYVPAKLQSRVELPADRLLRAMSALLVVPKTEGKGKPMTDRTVRITVTEGAVSMTASGDAGADAEDVLEAVVEDVAPGTFWQFNSRFLREAVEACGAKTVAIHPSAEIGKSFHVAGSDGATFLIGQRAG